MATAEKQTITGTVTRANETGIVLDTLPDVWLNKSTKGDAAALVLPLVGQHITAVVTAWKDRYYLQSITIASNGNANSTSGHRNGHTPAQDAPATVQEAQAQAQAQAQEPDKDRRITRLACLNTAAAVLTHNLPAGEAVKAEHLEALAARLEAWVYRPVAVADA